MYELLFFQWFSTYLFLSKLILELQRDGLIKKIVYAEVPPKVEFLLTDIRKALFPAIDMIQDWSIKYFPNEN